MTSSIGDRPLSSIDKSLVAAGGFLKELMKDCCKLRCLEAFANSFKIVDWIRKVTSKGCINRACSISNEVLHA